MSGDIVDRLPLSFTHTQDYAEVRDARGNLVALTTDPAFFTALAERAAKLDAALAEAERERDEAQGEFKALTGEIAEWKFRAEAELRHECAASGMHDHDGCDCSAEELARRAALAPEGKPPLIGTGLSDETKAALAEIDEAQRAAAKAVSSTTVGRPAAPAPEGQ